MREIIQQSVLIYIVLTVITGLLYPMAITAIAQFAFPDKANGSLITDRASGKVIGSELIGQEFTEPNYFWGRLSGTSPAYNAGASSGTNFGPLNPAFLKNAKTRVDALTEAGSSQGPVPVDLVTASGSGLDPHISVSSARYQVKRVAQSRGMSENTLAELVTKHVERRQFGFLGEARVNVLKLNIALDQIAQAPANAGSE